MAFFPFTQSCPSSPPLEGSFFILDDKETNNQGLELMLDKLVETLFATVARNEEKSFLPLFWFFGLWVVVHKFQLLLLPSSPMPDSRMQMTTRIISIAINSSLLRLGVEGAEAILINGVKAQHHT